MAVTYIVASGKGGAGKSSVTAGLSLALCERGKKVLCVDADIGFKSLDLIFNVGEGAVFSWLDVIAGSCTVSEAVVKCGENGPCLLIPPNDYSPLITGESFKVMLSMCKIDFDYIFIDVPAGWNEISEYAASAADKALVIITPDAVCVRSAAGVVDRLSESAVETRLIVNALVKDEVLIGNQLQLDFCVDGVRAGLIGVIPKDSTVALLPLSKKLSQYVFSAFRRTAARIDGERIPFKSKNL